MIKDFEFPILEEITENSNFVIDSDSKADWALQKIAEEQSEYDRLNALAEEQISEIKAKIEAEKQRFDNKTRFLKGALNVYFMNVPHKETKTQESYKLLSGSLVMKKATQKMVKDDAKLLEYFHNNEMQEFIKTEEKPAWAEFKKNCAIVDGNVVDTSTGEIVTGVAVEDVPEQFDIKL